MRLLPSWVLLTACCVLTVACQRPYFAQKEAKPRLLAVSDTSSRSAEGPLVVQTAAYLRPLHDSLERTMNAVLVQSTQRLRKGQPESELGNLMSDLMLEMGREKTGKPLDVAMTNNGGLRNEFPAGPITLGNVFEMMPFDNTLVVLTLDGPTLRQFAEYVADRKEPQAGLRLVVDKTSGTLREFTIGGRAFDSTRTYTLITTDYIANSSDAAAFLKTRLAYNDIHYLYRDAIADYLRRKGQRGETLNPQKDGRFQLH